MNYSLKIMALILVFASVILAGCNKAQKEEKSKLLLLSSRGGGGTFTADGVTFKMAYVPGGITFPIGVDDDATTNVANAYWIGETEVTYELWHKAYEWATDAERGASQYTFTFTGGREPRAGSDGIPGSDDTTSQQPVAYLNWRSAMAWCNALTEWYNAQSKTTYSCVYFTDSGHITPIRSVDDTGSINATPGSQDNPYVKPDAKGFRLVTKNEWELAARWRNDATNTVLGYSSPWFTMGNSASGATTYYNDNTGGSGEPGKSANDLVAVYYQYWDGAWVSTGVTDTAVVKSKADGANSLGLYDMSGNLWEWCFDWCVPNERRFIQGGSYFNFAEYLQVGFVGAQFPYEEFLNYGLRIARSAD